MLEPEIKFEDSEEIFTGQGGQLQLISNESGELLNNAGPVRQKRSYSDHLQSLSVCGNPVEQQVIYGANNFTTVNPSINSQDYYGIQQQQLLPPADPAKKRQRRYETNILFQHPFFNLLEDWDSARTGEAITAKCLSCKVTLRGHKNVSSNFIKHMKRLHPELYKLYESYKLFKYKGYPPAETVTSGKGKGETAFFDASAFLEQITTNPLEEQATTETPPTTIVATDDYTSSTAADTQGTDSPLANIPGSVRLVAKEKILEQRQSISEVDLSAKTLQQMSKLLDKKLNGFVTIAQLQEERKSLMNMMDSKLEETLSSSQGDNTSNAPTVTSSMNTTDTSMQTQIDALKLECEQLRDAIKRAQQGKLHLQAELQSIDQAMRQRKLFIRNLQVLNGEWPKQAVERLFRELLHLPDVQVKNVMPLICQTNKLKSSLLVELHKAHDSQVILRNCGKLKNTGIVVESALGPHALRRKHKLLVLRRELLRRNTQLKVFVRNTQLFVGGKEFYWDVVDGLGAVKNQTDDNLDTDDVVEALNGATGLDMKEFLNVLKNYNVN